MIVTALIVACLSNQATARAHVTLLSVEDSRHTLERASLRDGKLHIERVWSVERPGLTPSFVASGTDVASVLCSDIDGRSHLLVVADDAPEAPLATLESRVGFSFGWVTPTHLRVGGRHQGLTTRLGRTILEVVPEYRAGSVSELFPEFVKDATVVLGAMEELHVQASPLLGVGSFPFFPVDSSQRGAYSAAQNRFVLTVDGPDDTFKVVLYSIAPAREIAVLRSNAPRSISMGGGLVAVVEGEWDKDGTCTFFSSADGRLLGSRNVRCVG